MKGKIKKMGISIPFTVVFIGATLLILIDISPYREILGLVMGIALVVAMVSRLSSQNTSKLWRSTVVGMVLGTLFGTAACLMFPNMETTVRDTIVRWVGYTMFFVALNLAILNDKIDEFLSKKIGNSATFVIATLYGLFTCLSLILLHTDLVLIISFIACFGVTFLIWLYRMKSHNSYERREIWQICVFFFGTLVFSFAIALGSSLSGFVLLVSLMGSLVFCWSFVME